MQKASPPLIAALALAGLLVLGMIGAGVYASNSGSGAPAPAADTAPATAPVNLVPVDSPQAGSDPCRSLVAALPTSLSNGRTALARRTMAGTSPAGTAAWGGTVADDDPVVLRCGLAKPDELTPTSELLTVDGVYWLQVNGDDAATWYAVNRSVYVALTLPSGVTGTGPLQEISSVLAAKLPATG
ncbi:MAG TPA: DUF3515 domain-containing protein [Pseudonocardiaceae bacterium]|nr:DUF3515 domain-containing protein [Pseudonocardiaceae bacterium]